MIAAPVLERLRAWERGAPLPTTATLPFPRASADDRLALAFVRMGGESVPWGVALGAPGTVPTCLTLPEPRDRDAHAAFVLRFARTLLAHVGHPSHLPAGANGFPRALLRARQLWVPGPSHLEMLHLLDFRYTLTQSGEGEDGRTLRAFGRACGWLFRESTRPGQVRVFDATARLREAYTFPAEPVRQQHLGYLLAWLTEGTRDAREQRAAAAERSPVGTSLMPEHERETLEGLVKSFHGTSGGARAALTDTLHRVLEVELRTRWALTVEALGHLDADPRPANPQLAPVIDLGLDECEHQYFSHELRGLDPTLDPEERRRLGTHPETDFAPVRAARRYFHHLHAHELSANELVHGDKTLLERALDAGDGFTGDVTDVYREGGATSGPVRWRIDAPADDALRLREESKVCLVGAPKRGGVIVSLATEGDRRRVVVEFSDGLTRRAVPEVPDAIDRTWVGRTVTLLDRGAVGISLRKARALDPSDGPGAWLTHAAPLPEPSPTAVVRPDLVAFVRTLQ
jgi:hypothetical protein